MLQRVTLNHDQAVSAECLALTLKVVISAFSEVSARRSHLKLELRSQVGQKVYFVLGNEYCTNQS